MDGAVQADFQGFGGSGRSSLVRGRQSRGGRRRGARGVLRVSKKVGVLTGGGDCPGLNPAIRGCVMRGLDHGFEFIGLQEGWRGLVEGKIQALGLPEVKEIVGKGGTILGTSRTNPFKMEGAVQKCLDNFKK